jgi:hypothetical protein
LPTHVIKEQEPIGGALLTWSKEDRRTHREVRAE